MSGAHPTDSSTAETHPVRRPSTPTQPHDHPPHKTPANKQHPWFRQAQPTAGAVVSTSSTDGRGRGFDMLNRRDGSRGFDKLNRRQGSRGFDKLNRRVAEVRQAQPTGLADGTTGRGGPWFRQACPEPRRRAQPTGWAVVSTSSTDEWPWFRQAQPRAPHHSMGSRAGVVSVGVTAYFASKYRMILEKAGPAMEPPPPPLRGF